MLLVTFDTLRADHCSTYGYERETTPSLTRLAEDGVRFATAYAPMPTTLPSHASLFTGRLPRELGVPKNGIALAPEFETLAEILQSAGYRTAAFVSSFVLDRVFGLASGFEVYDDRFPRGACKRDDRVWEGFTIDSGFCRRGDATRERAQAWLRENGYLYARRDAEGERAPYFLWIHLVDAHDPYDPPPAQRALFPPQGDRPSELARQIAAHDGEVRFADDQLGALLDTIERAGRLDDTLVIATSDHGEGLMDHGWMHHGAMIYEEAVRIPLVVRWPARLARGRTVEAPVQLADLFPTVLELVGLPAPEGLLAGQSLAGALEGRDTLDPSRPILVQRRLYESEREPGIPTRGEKLGVRMGNLKYIEARVEKTYELFDLTADPGELHNVFRARRAEAAPLAAALNAFRSRPAAPLGPVPPSSEMQRRLEALGYVH